MHVHMCVHVRMLVSPMFHLIDATAPLHKDLLSIEATVGWSMFHLTDATAPLHKDHLSIAASVGWLMFHLTDAIVSLHKDHLSIAATVGRPMLHLTDTTVPLHEDHLSIAATVGRPMFLFCKTLVRRLDQFQLRFIRCIPRFYTYRSDCVHANWKYSLCFGCRRVHGPPECCLHCDLPHLSSFSLVSTSGDSSWSGDHGMCTVCVCV